MGSGSSPQRIVHRLAISALLALTGLILGSQPASAQGLTFAVGPRVIFWNELDFEIELERERLDAGELWALKYEVPGGLTPHEPIFGVGPRVIWKDGLGLEIELQRQRLGAEELWALNYEVLYGLTSNLALTLEVPQILDAGSSAGSNSGLGDVLLRAKWRFYRKDVLGGTYQAAVLGGVEFPTGEYGVEVPTGSGTYDLLAGLAVDYEGRRWLMFGAGRYKRNGTMDAGIDVGDALLVDAAIGFRPVKTGYRELDTVVMAELNYESHGRWESAGGTIPNTGGDLLFLSTGVWFTYRNHAFKPGVQVPIHTDLSGIQEEPDWRAVFAYEVHFGSVFGR